MTGVLWVFLGGGLGSAGRFLVTRNAERLLGPGHPIGTFIVNLLGCFAIGVLAAFFASKLPDHASARAFVITGFLGGFTTYSAYAQDVVNLLLKGDSMQALIYAMGTMVVGVSACIAGVFLARLLLSA
jgi:CrcB protein